MLKIKKAQFAIRKLTTGAAAVLLTFGALAGTAAPTQAATNGQTAEVQQNTAQTPVKKYDQKIEYYDQTGQRISHITAFQLAAGESVTTEQLKQAIDSNLPDGYELVPGFYYPDGFTMTGQDDPADIRVKVVKKATEPDQPTVPVKKYDQKIEYYDQEGQRLFHFTAFQLAAGESITTDQLKQAIDSHIPDDYEVANDFAYPNGFTATEQDPADIKVQVVKKAIAPEFITVNPTNPETQPDLFKRFTRHIHITDHEGKQQTISQHVLYSRSKTGPARQWTYSDWNLHNQQNTGWAKHALTVPAGHQAKINYAYDQNLISTEANTVNEHQFPQTIASAKNLHDMADEYHVYVTMHKDDVTYPGTDPIEPDVPGIVDPEPEVPVLPEDPITDPNEPLDPDFSVDSENGTTTDAPNSSGTSTNTSSTSTNTSSTVQAATKQPASVAATAATPITATASASSLPAAGHEGLWATLIGLGLTVLAAIAAWFTNKQAEE